jgi:hypothetical protein
MSGKLKSLNNGLPDTIALCNSHFVFNLLIKASLLMIFVNVSFFGSCLLIEFPSANDEGTRIEASENIYRNFFMSI